MIIRVWDCLNQHRTVVLCTLCKRETATVAGMLTHCGEHFNKTRKQPAMQMDELFWQDLRLFISYYTVGLVGVSRTIDGLYVLYYCACDGVWLCEGVSEENEADVHKPTYWFHIWRTQRGCVRESLGGGVISKERRNVAEREAIKQRDGSETDNGIIQMIWNVVSWTHVWSRADKQGTDLRLMHWAKAHRCW